MKKSSIKRIRKLKYHFLRMRMHRCVPGNPLIFLGHMSAMSKWISARKGLKFTDYPCKTFNYERRLELYRYVIDNELPDKEIDYLEFGVATGGSFRWWLKNIDHKDSRFYGFDTFSGLPEDWGPFKKGDMSNGNEPPEVDDTRCQFYQGVFQDTLYNFLNTYKAGKRKVVHLDADLYSSTLFVLTTLSPYLNKGDILLFDEFNVPLHEYKAFREWSESFYIKYSVIAEVNNFYQVAIKIG